MSGRDMELISRRNKYISPADFRARMMPTRITVNEAAKPHYVYSTFSMRMTRFRWKQGLITWLKRDGSNLINQFMGDRLSPQCRAENSTLYGFDLEKVELKKLELLERDEKYLKWAGARAIGEAERKARNDKTVQQLAKLEEAIFPPYVPSSVASGDLDTESIMDQLSRTAQQLANLEETTLQQNVPSGAASGDLCTESIMDHLSHSKKRGIESAYSVYEESNRYAPDNALDSQALTRPKKRNKGQGSVDIETSPSIRLAHSASSPLDQAIPQTLSENSPEENSLSTQDYEALLHP